MRKRRVWTVILFLFRIVPVISHLPNETFDLSRYYADRIVVEELEDGSERSYFVAAHTRNEAVDKFSLLSSNCSLLDQVEEYTCDLDETFCNYPNNTILKTYKFEQESCKCNLDECDSETNSSQLILYPGCFCEKKENQCDLSHHGSCSQWNEKSDHKELSFNSFPHKASKYHFDYFIQAGSETAILNRKTVSMVSSLFRQSGFNCSLQFMHHFTSQSSSSRLVVRSINQFGERRDLYEYNDKPLKTVWKPVTVAIGSFSEPFRISIDCETGSAPKRRKAKLSYTPKVFACGLAKIHFDSCSDIRNPLEMCSHGDQFLCSTPTNTVCLKDVQCDSRTDCDDGSDEMECGSVTGTMCNFDSPDGFCDGWVQRTRIMGSLQSQFEPTTIAPVNKIEEKPSYLLKKRGPSASVREARKGSGQMLVFDAKENLNLSRKKSVLQSPPFPRTNPAAYDPESSLFETCTLRFYVCTRTYSKTWDISIIAKSGNPFDSGKTFLYEGAYDSTLSQRTSVCEWERVIILVPRQNAGFRLGIFVESFPREDFFAIDDLSFSPSCFEKAINQSTWEIPDLKITTCESTGFEKPESCKKDRELDGQTGHFLKEDGSQEWTVPVDGFYRIDACGAGGGSTSAANGEPGDCVTLQVHLMENIALRMLIGQVGESACLTEQDDELRPSSCTKTSINGQRNKEGGAGGGGATLIKVESDLWNVVVGGGAGASWIGDDVDVGYGASAIPMDFDDKCNTTCSSISHSDFFVDRSENRCPKGKDNHTTVYGGFGGGGNSCGMLGGSGAGYKAGNPFGRGRERSGTSNVTENFSKDVLYFQSNKVEEGFIKIKFCRKTCAKPSVCRFRKDYYDEEYCGCPDGSNYTETPESCACPLTCPYASTCQYRNFTFEPFCLCENGKFLDDFENEYCEEPQGWAWYNYMFLIFLIFTIIGASLVVYHYQSREKQMKQEIFDLTQMKSPDYLYDDIYFGRTTRKAALDRLNTIPRDEIQKGKVLGKGNFGEVFLGVYKGQQLAVKTISKTFSASQASQADFCNEALCMGTFVGDNVVKLIGIDFDELPFMIAIEYMAGGDLLTFVKDSRPTQVELNPLKLSMSDLVRICCDVASGCQCLESYGYVHRDIAARNILLTTRNSNRIAKIADFGMAKEITYGSEYYRVHGRAMLPIKWTPPEAFIDGVFTTKSDVWSFGILCWEVFSLGVVPYPNRRNEEVMLMLTEGARLEYPYGIPTRIYQLMRDCWSTAADARPQFTEVVNTLNDILVDPECIEMSFPIHPTVRLMFERAQQTLVCVETPKTTVPDNSDYEREQTQEEKQDRMNLHVMMLKREKPYNSEMAECVIASLRKDLARVEYETGTVPVPQPEYLSPQTTEETAYLLPAELYTYNPPPPPFIDLKNLGVQNTGPTLHRPDSLNFKDPYRESQFLIRQTR